MMGAWKIFFFLYIRKLHTIIKHEYILAKIPVYFTRTFFGVRIQWNAVVYIGAHYRY